MIETIVLLLCGLLFAFIILATIGDRKNREEMDKGQNRYIAENNIPLEIDHVYINDSRMIRVVVDNQNKALHVSAPEITTASNPFIRIPFSEVTGCEIKCDSEVVGGVGRAIVGSVVAGAAGAIVGAITAKQAISSYSVIIYRNNISSPMIELELIWINTKTQSVRYDEAQRFANQIVATVKAIVSQNGI